MNRTLLPLIPLLLACAGPSDPRGDWDVLSVQSGDEEQAATGILEVDRDGETLFRVNSTDLAFDAFGRSTLSNNTADLLLFDGQLAVEGPCTAADGEMTCDLLVDDVSTTVWLMRERD